MRVVTSVCSSNTVKCRSWVQIRTLAIFTSPECPYPWGTKKGVVHQIGMQGATFLIHHRQGICPTLQVRRRAKLAARGGHFDLVLPFPLS